MTKGGPTPQRYDPSAESDVVGIWMIGPAPQITPPFGSAGDKKAEKSVGPMPFVRESPGKSAGCETTGTMVRVMMFHSGVGSNGITGWMLRMFWFFLSGP